MRRYEGEIPAGAKKRREEKALHMLGLINLSCRISDIRC
jgi:hypothetical protein